MKQFLEAGRLNSPRGLKGEIHFECWCDGPDFLEDVTRLYLDAHGKQFLEVDHFLPHLGTVVFKGYPDRTAVSELVGKVLWFDRDEISLSKGSYFNDDIIGTPVFNSETEQEIGLVRSIEERGNRFYWHIQKEQKEFIFPAVKDFIRSVEPGKKIIIQLIDGMDEWYEI